MAHNARTPAERTEDRPAAHACKPAPGVYDWQTEAMTRRKYEINAQMRFYKQEYCGCSYSLRDNNLYRKMHGQPPVRIGGEEAGSRYVDPEADAAGRARRRCARTPRHARRRCAHTARAPH